MRKRWKRIIITLLILIIIGFLGFLYFIPPLTSMAPEEFIKPEQGAPPSLADIADPAEKLLAERGKYLVSTTGCTGCHTPQGSQGPDWSRYLAGGSKHVQKGQGEYFSRNLTPDTATGLGRRKPDQIRRILRTGLNTEGRIMSNYLMPWPEFSHWTEEDRYAVVVYLRHLRPVHNAVPDPNPNVSIADPHAFEEDFGADYSLK